MPNFNNPEESTHLHIGHIYYQRPKLPYQTRPFSPSPFRCSSARRSIRCIHSSSCAIISRTCCRFISKNIVPSAAVVPPPPLLSVGIVSVGCRHSHTIVANCCRNVAKLLEPSTHRMSQSSDCNSGRCRPLNSANSNCCNSMRRVQSTSSTDCCKSAGKWAKCNRNRESSSSWRCACRRHSKPRNRTAASNSSAFEKPNL